MGVSDPPRGGFRRIALPAVTLLVAAASVYAVGTSGFVIDSGPVDPAKVLDATSKLTQPPAPGPRRIDYRTLDQRIERLMQDPDMVGLGVAVIENGAMRFVKGYGVTQAGGDERVTPDTVFRWASLSKGVAGTLIVDLAREGRLSLDAPIASFGTSLRLPGGGETRVSVRDLLSHRVGIVRNAYDDRLEDGEDPHTIRTSLGTLPPYCPPASCYTYQNIAFDAASEIVERTAGLSYAAAVRTRLFAPLGMTEASIGRAGLERARNWARPHRRGGRPATLEDAYYRVPAAGGVNSSIFDLARWMQAQMGGAPGVLPRGLLDAVHAPLVATPPHGPRGPVDRALDAQSYGLGWRDYHYAGHRQIGHRGAVDGYRSLILFDPAEKAGIALLWNSHADKPVGLQLELLDMIYRLPRHAWMELEPVTAAETADNARLRPADRPANAPVSEARGRP